MSEVPEANGRADPISMDRSKVSEANNGTVDHSMVETRVVEGKTNEVIEGKLDWRGRPAVRGRHGGVANSLFILANFGFENMASLSLAVNLILYFMRVMHIGLTDASNLLTNYMGTSYMVAVLISVFADIFIGRYMTVILSSLVELVGLVLLTLQARSDRLKPPSCRWPVDATCQRVHGHNEVHLYLSLYLIAIGSAGIKAALPAHCADQFDEKHPKERLQMSSCFNWLLLSLCTGGAISVTAFVYVQERDWAKGFAATTGAMGVAVIVFIAGLPRYRIAPVKGGSALTEIFQVYVAAIRNMNLQLPENPDDLYEISRSNASPDTEFVEHRPVQIPGPGGHRSDSEERDAEPVAAVPADAGGARQDGAGHGAHLLQRHHHGHLPRAAADLLHRAGQHHGQEARQAGDAGGVAAHHPAPLPHLRRPHLRASVRALRAPPDGHPFRHHLPPARRRRPRALHHLHGHRGAGGGEAQEGGRRARHAGHDPRAAAPAHLLLLAGAAVRRLRHRRHVHLRRPHGVLLLAGAPGAQVHVLIVPVVLPLVRLLHEHHHRAGRQRGHQEVHGQRRMARRQHQPQPPRPLLLAARRAQHPQLLQLSLLGKLVQVQAPGEGDTTGTRRGAAGPASSSVMMHRVASLVARVSATCLVGQDLF